MKKVNLIIVFAFICSIFQQVRAQYGVLLNFNNVLGVNPYGDLYFDGTFLYGMTRFGGDTIACGNGCGRLFKIRHDGTSYTPLLDFDNLTSGWGPEASLISDGVYLYGMTSGGGTNGYGTIFKVMPDGSGYQNILNFNGIGNGNTPFGSLIYDGTYLYGMTTRGGMYAAGTIFKIKPDGTSYVKLMDFGSNYPGLYPYGSLIYDGTYLYGMTSGPYNNTNCNLTGCGNVFKVKTDGTGYQSVLTFNNTINGISPRGSLIYDGTYLFGMTKEGGLYGGGTIFRITPNSTNYLKLMDFASDTLQGAHPYGSLISDGMFLYGITSSGGLYGYGTIFKIMPDGTSYSKLFDFDRTINGGTPFGSLTSDGTALYGMTLQGGASDVGTIFKFALSVNMNERQDDNLRFSIYPSPTDDLISTVSNVNFNKIELLSITGQVLLSESVNTKTHQLQLQNLAEGIYFVKVIYANGMSVTKKVIKQ